MKNQAGNYVDPDPKNVTNAAASLPEVPADLRFSITDMPGAQAYPIAGSTWVLLYRDQPNAEQGKLVTAFIQWAITDGQKYSTELDYAVLAKSLVQKSQAALRSVTCRGKILPSEIGRFALKEAVTFRAASFFDLGTI